MFEKGMLFSYVFERPWPSKCFSIINFNDNSGNIISLQGDQNRHLIANYDTLDFGKRTIKFQRIKVNGTGPCLIDFFYKDGNINLQINFKKIEEDELSTKPILEFNSNNQRTKLKVANPLISKMMDDSEKFFLNTIIEIISTIKEKNTFKIIRSSGLLRTIFMDGNNFMNELRKKYSVKDFYVCAKSFDYPPELRPFMHMINIDPNGLPHHSKVTLKPNELLKHKIFLLESGETDVGHLISLFANEKGGSHYGKLHDKYKDAKIIKELDNSITLGDYKQSEFIMLGLFRVVISGLNPIVEKILSAYSMPIEYLEL